MNRRLINMHLDQATVVTQPRFRLSTILTGILIVLIIGVITSSLL